MSFDDFFFDHYLLYEFTKKELIYMDINGDIPFHMLSFAKDDEEFAAVRRTIVEKKTTLRGLPSDSRVCVFIVDQTWIRTTDVWVMSPTRRLLRYLVTLLNNNITSYMLRWSNG